MNKGKIVQVMGPVVDVVFEDGQLPDIKDALEVDNNRSHLETDLSLIPNFSASCFCVIPNDFRLPAIYFPILIRSIHLPPFFINRTLF